MTCKRCEALGEQSCKDASSFCKCVKTISRVTTPAISILRHDFDPSDAGKTGIDLTVNGKTKIMYLNDFSEACQVVEAIIELFELKRSNEILYRYSSNETI